MRPPRITEFHAQMAVARRWDWTRNLTFKNIDFCGGEMDVCIITGSGYIREIEIKLTRADWEQDSKKRKWGYKTERAKVCEFYYAVPEKLLDRPPEWLPETVGLLALTHVFHRGRWLVVTRLVRKAKRMSKYKATPDDRERMMRSCYYRFWEQNSARYFREIDGHFPM